MEKQEANQSFVGGIRKTAASEEDASGTSLVTDCLGQNSNSSQTETC